LAALRLGVILKQNGGGPATANGTDTVKTLTAGLPVKINDLIRQQARNEAAAEKARPADNLDGAAIGRGKYTRLIIRLGKIELCSHAIVDFNKWLPFVLVGKTRDGMRFDLATN
jgi:hypothetical protein